jgi:hypothetical protein
LLPGNQKADRGADSPIDVAVNRPERGVRRDDPAVGATNANTRYWV